MSPGDRAQQIRVVHLITGLDLGGAERVLHRLVTGLDRARFRSVVISLKAHGPVAKLLTDAGVEVVALDVNPGAPSPGVIVRLAGMLRGYRPDVLQTWLYHADLLGMLAARSVAIDRVVWNIRRSYLEEGESWSLRMLPSVLARISGLPSAVVVNSRRGREIHERLGYRCNWRLIANGFETDRFCPRPDARKAIRGSLGIGEDDPVVGILARVHPTKNHALFLDAARLVADVMPNTRFVLVGRGATGENNALVPRIERLGLGKQTLLLGERLDVPEILGSWDVSALTSTSEGFPNAVGESMACGLPCVATDVGDVRDLIGDTGRVVPVRNPHALATEILQLLSARADVRRELGRRARERIVNLYSLDVMLKAYARLYEDVAAGINGS
jgi:glycosyltransferase involved in cell wall biosynthesis